MASGIYSTISSLQTRLFLRWVPKWFEAFSNPEGGFYERLGKGFKPVLTGQRRLVTQCRQLAIYSDYATRHNKPMGDDLKAHFEFILEKYYSPQTGLWHFSINDKGGALDKTCDLYALSFVVFSLSHYFRASGDERAKDHAINVLKLIDEKFRMLPLPGLAESIGEDFTPLKAIRRQNPHMHLLEACLFAHATWKEPIFEAMADDMVALFYKYFYDARRDTLIEFFNDDLSRPHEEKGRYLEPGHYFEWIWLLKKHAKMKQDASLHDGTVSRLLDFANRFGWDSLYGGIFDSVAEDGRVMTDTKRIWPFCEALKANVLMLERVSSRQVLKDRVADMVQVFKTKYMQERGFWTEWLHRDLTDAADYMPGTTPYHVYFGITETMDVLNERGKVKSWTSKWAHYTYAFRRGLSGLVRRIRLTLHGAG